MAQLTISDSKLKHLKACSNSQGVISAAAMDQRGSLQRALKREGLAASEDHLREFKAAVTKALTPYASAILLDPRYGLEAGKQRAADTGLLLCYEESGYDNSRPGRLPDLQEGWSVKRLAEVGADAIKLLVYYNPFEDDHINSIKHAFVERVGAECKAEGLPLFLEPVTYDDALDVGFDFARAKPSLVTETIREFSRERYCVDVLKVEFPIDATYTDGLGGEAGQVAYTVEQAKEHIALAAEVATKPFIYLSAGVSMTVFTKLLELAGESGAGYNGVLCGRATWKGGIVEYAKHGLEALESWLDSEGTQNIEALNQVLARHATPLPYVC